MKILITGANGMLGHRMAVELAEQFETTVTQYGEPVSILGCHDLFVDLTQPIHSRYPAEIVIHTAALTDVDYCQKHPDDAWAVNVKGTENLVKAFPDARFVYISTDFVYDGMTGNYSETDLPHPINVYAETKYAAEKLLPAGSLIIRTCIFGLNLLNLKESLPEQIVKKLQAGQPLSLFNDLFSSPIYTGCLVKLIQQAIERKLTGVWNLAGSERVSKYEMGLKVAEVFGLNPDLIHSASASNFQFAAPRPRDVSLNTAKITETLGYPPPNLAESLHCFEEERKNGYHKSLFRGKNGSPGTAGGDLSGAAIGT